MSDILTSPRPSRYGRAIGFRLAGIGAAVQHALGAADAGRLRVLRAGRRAPRELVDAALALLGARGGGGMAGGGRDADPGGE